MNLPTAARNIVLVLASLIVAMMFAGAAAANGAPVQDRVGGDDRYATAIAASRVAFPTTAKVVYLASGSNFPDALSAGAVAARQNGALLITPPGELRPEVKAEITRLSPERIVVVGGPKAVSVKVEHTVASLARTVTRVGGTDRYATSRQLVASAFTGRTQDLYLVTGRNFPDALSVVPLAARSHSPVLLVDGTARSMDAATIGLIGKSTPDRITVVGGTAAVSQGVFDHAQRLAWTQRAAGANRYETSARIGAMWQSARRVYLATGENFPDALTGGVLAAKSDAPLFLIQPRCPAASFNAVSAWLDTTRLTILGGRTIAISQAPSQAGCTTVAPIEPRWEGPYLQ